MIKARPTAASAAATPIEKITNRIPVSASGCSLKRQNAMKFKFAALSMSSMPISTMMALRRVSAPARPTAKSMAESRRYGVSGVMTVQNTKHQKPNTKQIPSSKHQMSRWTSALEFGVWSFFGVWGLGFGVSFLLLLHRDNDSANERGG